MNFSLVETIIGTAGSIFVAIVGYLAVRRNSSNSAPQFAAPSSESIAHQHVAPRSHELNDLRDLRETLDELVAEDRNFIFVGYSDRRGELRLSFRWRAWNYSAMTAGKAEASVHQPIFFEFFAPAKWPGSGPVELKLLLGNLPDPGRSVLMEIAQTNPLFDVQQRPWPDGSRQIFQRTVLPESVRSGDRYARLRREWTTFVELDLPRLIAAFESPPLA